MYNSGIGIFTLIRNIT